MQLYRLRVLLSEFQSQHRHKLLRCEVLPGRLPALQGTTFAKPQILIFLWSSFSGCVKSGFGAAVRMHTAKDGAYVTRNLIFYSLWPFNRNEMFHGTYIVTKSIV
jgi:hypothetical protein